MSAAFTLVEFVGDNFEGEAGCNRTLDSRRSSVCLARVFQLGVREGFKGAFREGFKRFAGLGRLGPDEERGGARAVAAGVLFCVNGHEAGSKGDVADVEVRGWFGDERLSAETAGDAIATVSPLWMPGLSRGVGGGEAAGLDLAARALFELFVDERAVAGLSCVVIGANCV